MGAKISLDTSAFMNSMLKKLNQLEADTKAVTEKALKETHRYITAKAEESAENANLPAEGRYSTGELMKSLYREGKIHWVGDTAYVDVGFSISKGGLPSIFMIYGTPRYMKNQKMYDAFKSRAVLDEAYKIQEEVFFDELRRVNR